MATTDLIRSDFGAQLRPLTALHYVRTMRGATQAHLIQASNGRVYLVKFQNNPYRSRVLASEFLATRLGLWLGLSMPLVQIIEVPETLVNHALLRIEDQKNRLVRCASGRQLAIHYVPDSVSVLPRGLDTRLTVSN